MKAVVGTALLAGAIALTVATGGIGAIAAISAAGEMGALFAGVVVTAALTGAELDMSAIADALTDTPTTPQTIRSPAAPWKAIYGNVRTGGTIVNCNSFGDNFKYCDMVIALACHPCVGVMQHTEVIAGDATFPSFGGLYINGQGVQWRNNASGGSVAPGTYAYDVGQIPFGYATSNDIQDLNQNHYTFGKNVYMEFYDGSGKSYQAGQGQVDNQVSQFYITQGPSGAWNDNCTMMLDVGTSAYTGGTTGSPIYANEQGVPKGHTYCYLRLMYASTLWSGGLPQSLRFDVQGKNDIWDPRLNSGAGGYAYTNNAALVMADFLTNPYFGMGFTQAEMNQEQLIAAANICDTAIPLASGGSVAEYMINGVFDTSQNPASTLDTMRQAMGGNISYIGGQWYIFPGTYVYPTATVTESMMIGPMNISLNQKPRDLINAVKGSFICPAAIDTIGSPNIFLNEQTNIFNGQWQSQPFPPYAMDAQHGYSSDQWLAADGQKLYKEVSFPFTTNSATCQRLAKQVLLKNRNGNGLEDSQNRGLTFSVDCNLSAYDIVPHDTVWFDYPRFNWSAPPAGFSTSTQDIPEYTYTEFEVVNTSYSLKEQNGQPPVPVYTLQLRATSPNNWLWNPADELPMTENRYPQFANTMQIDPVSDFVIESGSSTVIKSIDGIQKSSILCTWTPPADSYVINGGQIIVQILPVNATAVTYTSLAADDTITITGTVTYNPGDPIVLIGAGVGGAVFSDTVFLVNGNTLTLLNPVPTAVTNGVVQAAGWQTVATLSGTTSSYSITGVSDGSQYYVQVYCKNSAGITSDVDVAGPITVSTGQDTFSDGLVVYEPGTTMAAIQAGASGNVLLQNANFEAGNIGWTLGTGWTIVATNGTTIPANPQGGKYVALHSGTATSAITNGQLIPCAAGNVLSASCQVYSAGANGGTAVIRVNYFTAAGVFIPPEITSAAVPLSGAAWVQARVVATAPATAAYANIDFAVSNNATGNNWFICGFAGSLQANSMAEVPDGGGYNKLLYVSAENTLSASTAIIPQGSIAPVYPFDVDFTASTTSAGISSVDFVWTADTLIFPDGSTLGTIAGTLTVDSLSPATAYYVFERVQYSTGILELYTPLPTSATNQTAINWQNQDLYIPFSAFAFTTPSTPASGQPPSTGSGSGGSPAPMPCPDAEELVQEKDRGIVRVGDVRVGDYLHGVVYDARGVATGEEFRRVVTMTTRYSETWYRVNGRKVSPHHPIRFLWDSYEWGDRWSIPHECGDIEYAAGTRVQITLDAADFNQANYLLYDANDNASLVMHNIVPTPPNLPGSGC